MDIVGLILFLIATPFIIFSISYFFLTDFTRKLKKKNPKLDLPNFRQFPFDTYGDGFYAFFILFTSNFYSKDKTKEHLLKTIFTKQPLLNQHQQEQKEFKRIVLLSRLSSASFIGSFALLALLALANTPS